jgi:hypothetical protein
MSQTVRKLLGQDLLVDFENYLEVHVKVYVRVVYSWFSWNPKGRKQLKKLLGRNLLVYFESYLKVHVKVYVKVVYSWFSWGLKVANSQETVGSGSLSFTSLLLCSNFLSSEARAMWSNSEFSKHFHFLIFI